MKKYRSILFALCASLLVGQSPATTVIPPTFDELVGEAEIILQGTVTEVRSQWVGEGGQRHIVSYVTLRVEDAVKGDPGATYTMRMLGGTVDGETMEVTDAPKFKVGEREILFVEHNGTQFIPLVGIMHGRFHIARDDASGRDTVVKENGQAVKDLSKLGQEGLFAQHKPANSVDTDAAMPALDPAAFKAAIRAKLQTR